jgi:hypothetical protein
MDDEMNAPLPFLDLIPYRATAPAAQIFVLFAVGEDQEESLSHRGRHLTTGAKESRGLEVLIVSFTRHQSNHNADGGIRQGIELSNGNAIP